MDGELLSATFVELTDTLVAGFDVIDFLHLLTDRSVQLLDVSAAGLLLADPRGELRVVAASSQAARLLELFQLQNDQGPCLDCFRTGRPVAAADLADAAQRWPRFAPAARQAGFAAVQALPMRLREQVIGALNLFGADAGALAPADIRVGQALADVATISLLHERSMRHSDTLNEQLQTALNSRVIIEQAKGKLPSASGWTWTRRSPCCAARPGPATAACPTWPRRSSTAPKPSPARPRHATTAATRAAAARPCTRPWGSRRHSSEGPRQSSR